MRTRVFLAVAALGSGFEPGTLHGWAAGAEEVNLTHFSRVHRDVDIQAAKRATIYVRSLARHALIQSLVSSKRTVNALSATYFLRAARVPRMHLGRAATGPWSWGVSSRPL